MIEHRITLKQKDLLIDMERFFREKMESGTTYHFPSVPNGSGYGLGSNLPQIINRLNNQIVYKDYNEAARKLLNIIRDVYIEQRLTSKK